MTTLGSPLSHNAQKLVDSLKPRILDRLLEVNQVPVSVLIWGPGENSENPLRSVREDLRSQLRQNGHAAVFSEELSDLSLPFSIRMQQLAQAQEFDLIVSIPCTPGSIGEIHDFASDRRVSGKVLVFLNSDFLVGYSASSLKSINSFVSCQIEYYPNETDTEIIFSTTLSEVQKIREIKYLLAGRY